MAYAHSSVNWPLHPQTTYIVLSRAANPSVFSGFSPDFSRNFEFGILKVKNTEKQLR
jgi:hypothetical protein